MSVQTWTAERKSCGHIYKHEEHHLSGYVDTPGGYVIVSYSDASGWLEMIRAGRHWIHWVDGSRTPIGLARIAGRFSRAVVSVVPADDFWKLGVAEARRMAERIEQEMKR